MNKALSQYFFREVLDAFAFVVKKHAFSAAQLEVRDQISFTFVIFMGKHVAIECILDEREDDIACIIARVVDGKRATCDDAVDDRDESGVRVREHLSMLLERHGARESLFTRVGSLDLYDRIPITLGDFAQMLKKHGHVVLNDSPSALA